MKEKIYLIERNEKYLDQLFCDDVNEMFNVTPTRLKKWAVYFYRNEQVARDVAEELGALLVPAFLNGDSIELRL